MPNETGEILLIELSTDTPKLTSPEAAVVDTAAAEKVLLFPTTRSAQPGKDKTASVARWTRDSLLPAPRDATQW